MNFKEFECLDKNYLTKKERKTYITIYSLILISTLLLSVVIKIDLLMTIGMIFAEGITATIILYIITKRRINPNNNKCEGT